MEKSDPSKVKILGPAVEGPVKANQPTSFTLDCSKAGPGTQCLSHCVSRLFSGFMFPHHSFVKVCDYSACCLITFLFFDLEIRISLCVCLCVRKLQHY